MVNTFCSAAEVIYKAGANASATATASDAIMTSFINEAEGVVMSETRTDWKTNYPSLTDPTKQILRAATAAYAAKLVINYDTSGFYSRQQAETALDVLDDFYNETLKHLKDVDTKDLRSAV